jgi:opacity protein-like surface antigen
MDLTTSIDFPTVIVAGYAWRPTDKWKFEVNLDWTQWDQVGDITLDFDAAEVSDVTQKQGFHNTVAYKLGSEYQYSDQLALRAGYIYNQTALALIFCKDRTIDNNVDANETVSSSSIDGTYEEFAICVSLATAYHF